jgi:hypothetical protein
MVFIFNDLLAAVKDLATFGRTHRGPVFSWRKGWHGAWNFEWLAAWGGFQMERWRANPCLAFCA